MARLTDISVEQLQDALDDVTGKKPAQRLIAAIAYKNGVPQSELAEWFGVQRRTIYSWFTRLEAEPLEEAVYDDHRSGRPRKLSDDQQERLEARLHESPSDVGYEAATWTPALVQQYLAETFDVEYSRPSCRRLMKEAGLQYRTPPRTAATADDTDGSTDDSRRGGRWVPE